MSDNTGVHDFAIPHECVQPTRDMVIVRMPLPPKKIGSIIAPDMYRDLAQYNVMAGRVVSMGPLAFAYKDSDGTLKKQDVKIGDWVTFRPFAGTYTQGTKVAGAGNWRYISSFGDVIGIIPADKMPRPETLLWDEEDDKPEVPARQYFDFDNKKAV